MASIIPGYEYDIFISYRQKDNKYDGWVNEFVSNLKNELETSIREELSVYFDMNSYDGLQENHDIADSLGTKLKCLIFMPIISRTYCDPKSFALEHELKTFVNNAARDELGLKIRLPNGNVASRVLPIRIYDLTTKEVESCEAITGVLRGIDFIFKTHGVNRPLRASEDHPGDNLNKTYYRDQVNKVANAIKEIIEACTELKELTPGLPRNETRSYRKSNHRKIKLIAGFLILLVASVILCRNKIFGHKEPLEKSIAVLPYEVGNIKDSMSEDFVETILNHLYKIKGLKIPPSKSSNKYRNLSIRDISTKLNVSYVLEVHALKYNDELNVTGRLFKGQDEELIWSTDTILSFTVDHFFEAQSIISKKVAEKINISINSDEIKRIDYKPTNSYEAYELFHQASNYDLIIENDKGIALLEKAIAIDSSYSDAYGLLSMCWIGKVRPLENTDRQKAIEKAKSYISKALQIDENCVIAHVSSAMIDLWFNCDFESTRKEYEIVRRLNPSGGWDQFFADYLVSIGHFDEAMKIAERNLNLDKNSIINWGSIIYASYFAGEPDKTQKFIDNALNFYPVDYFITTNVARIYTYQKKYEAVITVLTELSKDIDSNTPPNLVYLGIAFYNTGDTVRSRKCLNKLLSYHSPGNSPSFFSAAIYTAMGDKNNAIKQLNKAYNDHETELYLLNVEPLFNPLRHDPDFNNLLKKIGF